MPKEARRLAAMGREALEDGLFEVALGCFEKAIQLDRRPEICSNLAYCLARVRRDFQQALSLALEALNRDPDNPHFYLNYGRVLHLAGNKEQAIRMLRKGLEYGRLPAIFEELENFGIRKPPVFKKLHRDHFLNRCAGKVGARLRIR